MKKNKKSFQQTSQTTSSSLTKTGVTSEQLLQEELTPVLNDYRDGLLERASVKAKHLLKRYPKSALVMNVLASCYFSLKNYKSASANYLSALELMPDSAELHNNLGLCFKAQGDLENAEKHLNKAIKLFEKYPEANNNLGNVFVLKKEYDKALSCYYKSMSLLNNFKDPIKSAAKIELQKNNLTSVPLLLKKLSDIDPNDVEAQILNAQYDEKIGDYSAAAKRYNFILTQDQKNCAALINLANVMLSVGKWDAAEDALNRCIQAHPTYHVAYVERGKVLTRKGNHQEALNFYRKAYDLNKNETNTIRLMANALFSLGQYSDASKVFKGLLERQEIKAHDYLAAAAADYELGNWVECTSALRKGAELDPLDSFAQFLGGQVAKVKDQNTRKEMQVHYVNYLDRGNACENFLKLNMPPKKSAIDSLLGLQTKQLSEFLLGDPRYGSGKISPNFKLFDVNNDELRSLQNELVKVIEEELGTEIYIEDSFFNVFNKGGGTKPHAHISPHDEWFDLKSRKFALTYYLDVGDQSGDEPGYLELHEPDSKILPNNGDIIIFSASHLHSSKYDGSMNRIMLGINFYVY